ncbi:MAG: hypothetical protein HFI72_07495 [Peptococcaceae bacterium]|nr:hypothetical protein [Peptococcaceae bacterium]
MEQPLSNLIYDRTLVDVDNKTLKGHWAAEDLNRIEEWTLFLKEKLAECGYLVKYTPPTRQQRTSRMNFTYTGKVEKFVTPGEAAYTFTLWGAGGGRGSCTSSADTNIGGRGAKMVYTRELPGGTVLHILAGGKGTITNNGIVADGIVDACAGGGGGMSAVFREIPKITDERYQFEKDGIYLEPLVIAAGGGGGNDSIAQGVFTPGIDGKASHYIHPNNFRPYDTAAFDPKYSKTTTSTLGIMQFIKYDGSGIFFTRHLTGQGGFGCGGAKNNGPSAGGGWCFDIDVGGVNSWCVDDTAVGSDGIRGAAVNGAVRIDFVNNFWTREDFPIKPEIDRIRSNIFRLKTGFYNIPTYKAFPTVATFVNWQHANAMEWNLDQIYQWLEAMVKGFQFREANTIFMEAGGVFNR